MPAYEYRCASCGHLFEARHGYAEAAPPCPTCGAPEPRKVFQAVGIIVKGRAPSYPAPSCLTDAACPGSGECAVGGCLGSGFSRN
ncbi:MAG: zinc ribbon domain-containing protein [Chloroflexi bacterium]|nr:zinc ribbon domain-containing protein [Chloroflexota bacterium]